MNLLGFGKFIKKEREKRDWEQAELAARMFVKQQSVSRWEKGDSRPRYDDVLKLADIFSIDKSDLLPLAGYDTEGPDQSFLPFLPLHDLRPENFEAFCRDFIQELHPSADVHLYGGQGHKQEGIDLYAQLPKSKFDYQCKRHKQFGPAKIKAAVKKTTFVADHHYLLLSRPATPKARNEIQNYPEWTLWDRKDISDQIFRLPMDSKIRLVDRYFRDKLKSFLGVEHPSPWLTSEDYYRPLSGRVTLFSHGWSFVGRRKEQDLLDNFDDQETNNAILISGRGGVGKSRLLKEWSEKIEKKKPVRFVSQGVDIRPEDLEKLPTGPSYLVIDDAHERVDITVILNGIARFRQDMKVIVSSRPYGIARLKSDLTNSGFVYDAGQLISLGNLTVEDAKSLSLEILNDPEVKGEVQYAQRIAEITRDCPFFTVIGSRLVGEGAIKPELLNNEKRFQDELLSRFYDVLTGKVGGVNSESIGSLLKFLATIQPFNSSDPKLQDAVNKLLSRPIDEIIRDINALEDAGILLRRGTRLRVVPDLLADYIRAIAAYDEKGQQPTGYADRVFNTVKDELATNLLVNMSQLDWRLSANGAQASLLREIWKNLKDQFKKAKIYERAEILKALGKISYYQPEQSLEFVRLAIEDPTDEVEDDLKVIRDSYNVVTEKLPPILRYIAYNADYLTDTLDILKDLAQKDERATNPHPDHPIRVLQDLASIEPGKPGAYNEAVAKHVIEWLEKPTIGKFSPFDILDTLLETEGHQTESKGFTITMKPFKVRPEAVSGLRAQIVEAAYKEVTTKPLKDAMRALKTLSAALSYPHGILGQDITSAERNAWDAEIVSVLQKLEKLVANPKIDPFISVEVRGSVSWLAARGSEKTKATAQSVLQAIPTGIDYEISRAIVDSWGWTFEKDDGSFGRGEEKLFKWRKKLVDQLIDKYKDDFKKLIVYLEDRLDTLNAAQMTRHWDIGPFIGSIMETSPEFTFMLGDYLLTYKKSPLVDWLGGVVVVMSKHDRKASLILVEKALKKTELIYHRTVARTLGWGLFNLEIVEEELKYVKQLASSTDPFVRRNIVRVVKRFPDEKKSVALEILLSIDITDEKEIADEVLREFEERHGKFKTEDLTEEQLGQILSKLVKCPSIDEYHINLFLNSISVTHPLDTLKLLIDRIEYKEKNEGLREYHPLPYNWRDSEKLRFHETPQYEQVLRKVRDWASEPTESWVRIHFGPDLFKLVSAGFDSTTLKILEEWLMSTDTKQIESAAALLSEAHRNFIWMNEDFVINLLERAYKVSSACYRRVCSSLHTSLLQGVRSGTAGQPFPEDITQRDKSYEIMSKLPQGSPASKFFKSLYEEAKIEIERHTLEEDDLE